MFDAPGQEKKVKMKEHKEGEEQHGGLEVITNKEPHTVVASTNCELIKIDRKAFCECLSSAKKDETSDLDIFIKSK